MDNAMGPEQSTWWVVCLCAAWCGVCRDWLPQFTAHARSRTDLQFAWVDVEDEDDAMGEVDIETFPTLLVARDNEVLYLAPIPPLGTPFARLLARLQAQPRPDPGVPADANALLHRLQRDVLARSLV
jgi:thioredoxin 1